MQTPSSTPLAGHNARNTGYAPGCGGYRMKANDMVDLEQFRRPVEAFMESASVGMSQHAHPASEFERECYMAAAADFDEADRLLSIIDNAWADGVHSCGTNCKRPMCVLRRENAELRDRLAQQPAAAPNEAARLLAICQNAHDRLLRGDDDSELLAILEQAWNAREAQGVGNG